MFRSHLSLVYPNVSMMNTIVCQIYITKRCAKYSCAKYSCAKYSCAKYSYAAEIEIGVAVAAKTLDDMAAAGKGLACAW